ncbi:hypothetical protein ACH4FX_36460 [Streptomyces sp. NPDC018019]|uniref:hypothetical protein n=1 Tax=Streptomyces sp. NPDC018019 TaxID=3365030 RepID=UPI0037A3E8A9
MDTWLAGLEPLVASVLAADICWGASATFRGLLAAARPADLPPLTLLASDAIAPGTHAPLFAPLLETLHADGPPDLRLIVMPYMVLSPRTIAGLGAGLPRSAVVG